MNNSIEKVPNISALAQNLLNTFVSEKLTRSELMDLCLDNAEDALKNEAAELHKKLSAMPQFSRRIPTNEDGLMSPSLAKKLVASKPLSVEFSFSGSGSKHNVVTGRWDYYEYTITETRSRSVTLKREELPEELQQKIRQREELQARLSEVESKLKDLKKNRRKVKSEFIRTTLATTPNGKKLLESIETFMQKVA